MMPAEAEAMDDAGWSAPVERLLGPMLPPAVVDALSSPLVLAQTLFAAVVSSSSALILPLLLLAAGLFSRRVRRQLGEFLAGV